MAVSPWVRRSMGHGGPALNAYRAPAGRAVYGGRVESVADMMARETALVLATRPQDAAGPCAGLVAAACTSARPPMVAVLTDGAAADDLAAQWERHVRAAMRAARLPRGRLLMLGVHQGTAPAHGWLFERVVEALTFVMWMRDCNLIVAPPPGPPGTDQHAAHLAARAVADRSGVSFTLTKG